MIILHTFNRGTRPPVPTLECRITPPFSRTTPPAIRFPANPRTSFPRTSLQITNQKLSKSPNPPTSTRNRAPRFVSLGTGCFPAHPGDATRFPAQPGTTDRFPALARRASSHGAFPRTPPDTTRSCTRFPAITPHVPVRPTRIPAIPPGRPGSPAGKRSSPVGSPGLNCPPVWCNFALGREPIGGL